jgi:hypothetical protein
MPQPEIQVLVDNLDEAFDRKAWHGPNLRNSIRGVTAAEASWRPEPRRHNIWELTLHAAYWKYVVRRKLTVAKRGAFALKGGDFFSRPVGEPQEVDWKADIAILESEHRSLRTVVAALVSASPPTLRLIRGAAAHDLYHAGQIRLLRRLQDDSA